mmetsp:Transcript_11283/g.12918  ORF Transcript_11283/g.12918 Transcript_11283/m.12918 type:complete len:122 (+) Transcript_11283:89-454(+)
MSINNNKINLDDPSLDVHKPILSKKVSNRSVVDECSFLGNDDNEEGCTGCVVDVFQSSYLTCYTLDITPKRQEQQKQDVSKVHEKQLKQREKIEELRQRIQNVEEKRCAVQRGGVPIIVVD